uniref:Minor capsid protein P11 C-terminal conserved region domain-containing protein n=1 Tax=viral metagenome TaxID=1070528 RepID=A0A6C0HRW2_9ZZZZ
MKSFGFKSDVVRNTIVIALVIVISFILWNKFGTSSPKYYETIEQMQKKKPVPANINDPTAEFQTINSNQLLPKDTNSEWNNLNPSGTGELSNINLLKSGWQIGIDTVGQTLRNANLQLRSEPPNPQISVGPWNNSTITPDFMRVPLEIGAGPQ